MFFNYTKILRYKKTNSNAFSRKRLCEKASFLCCMYEYFTLFLSVLTKAL